MRIKGAEQLIKVGKNLEKNFKKEKIKGEMKTRFSCTKIVCRKVKR